MSGGKGVIRLGIAVALVFGSMSIVIHRQSRALEVLREMDATRTRHAIVESERAQIARTIMTLESRTHVVAAAQRIGLRVPSADEIVILPLIEQSEPVRSVAVRNEHASLVSVR